MAVSENLPSISFEGLDISPGDTAKFVANFNEQQRRLGLFTGELNVLASAVDQAVIDARQKATDAAVSANQAKQSEEQAAAVVTAPLAGVIGAVSTTLVDLPMHNSLEGQWQGEQEYSCATAATYIDRYGVVRMAEIDEPVFGNFGRLCWGTATNYLLYSNDLSSAVWNRVRLASVDAAGIFAGLNMQSPISDNGFGQHNLNQVFSCPTGVDNRLSFYLKKGTYLASSIRVRVSDANGFIGDCFIQLSDCTPQGGTLGATTVDLADGVSLIKVDAFQFTSASAQQVQVISWDFAGGSDQVQGDGTTPLFTATGFNNEQSGDHTPLIITLDAPSTRTGNIQSLPYAGNMPDLTQRTASFGISFEFIADRLDIEQGLFAFVDAVFRYMLVRISLNGTFNTYREGGSTGGTVVSKNQPYKVLIAVAGDNLSVYLDGELKGTAVLTPVANNGNPHTLRIASYGYMATNSLNGQLRNFKIFNLEPNAEVAKLI